MDSFANAFDLCHVIECLVSNNICTVLWVSSLDILWMEVTGLGPCLCLILPGVRKDVSAHLEHGPRALAGNHQDSWLTQWKSYQQNSFCARSLDCDFSFAVIPSCA